MYLTIEKVSDLPGQLPKIGDLDYGVFVTGLPRAVDSVYIKIKKKSCKQKKSLFLTWTQGYCVLLNVQWGTIREIPADTPVQPLVASLSIAEPTKSQMKSFYKD